MTPEQAAVVLAARTYAKCDGLGPTAHEDLMAAVATLEACTPAPDLRDRDGDIWVCAAHGLYILRGDELRGGHRMRTWLDEHYGPVEEIKA